MIKKTKPGDQVRVYFKGDTNTGSQQTKNYETGRFNAKSKEE